jgi:septal ring factor EnvC (AmiA/AmiB activator)
MVSEREDFGNNEYSQEVQTILDEGRKKLQKEIHDGMSKEELQRELDEGKKLIERIERQIEENEKRMKENEKRIKELTEKGS